MEARVVMGYILAAILVILKVLGVIVAVLAGLLLIAASLPARFRVSGSVKANDLLERALDDDARVVFRQAGTMEAGEQDSSEEVYVDLDYSLAGSFGPVAVASGSGQGTQVQVLWWQPRIGGQRRTAGKDSGSDDGDAQPSGADSSKAKAKRAKAKKRGKRPGVAVKDIKKWLAPEVRSKAVQTVKDVLGALNLWTDLDVECGFPDRGYTGMAYAAYVALGHTGIFGGIRFHPRFDREVLNARGSFGFRVVPIQVAWIAGKLLLAREIRPLWWSAAVRRRKDVTAVKAVREAQS